MFDDVKPAELTSANVLVLDMMNQQMLDRYNAKHTVDLIAAGAARAARCWRSAKGCCRRSATRARARVFDDTARALLGALGLQQPGRAAEAGAHARRREGAGRFPKPEPSLDFGYYYPDGRDGRVFATWDEFAAWTQAHGKQKPGAPRIALGFYKSSYYSGETELLDAVIARDRDAAAAKPIPFFGYPDAVAASAAARRRARRAARRRGAVAALPLRRSRSVGDAGEGRHPASST